MQSSQPGPNDDFDPDEPDIPSAIPDFVRAWESALQVASSVRRPSILPSPQSYHEVIEPQAIFELDEKQEDGSIKTILVVPSGCKRCKSLKQACSRTRPACVRCRKAGLSCGVVQGGYQRLPGPKVGKPSVVGKQSASGTCKNSKASPSAPKEPTVGRSRVKRIASRAASLSQAPPSNPRLPIVPGSKRPLSPGSDSVLPRKKTQAKTASRSGKARCHTVVASEEVDTQRLGASAAGPSVQAASAAVSSQDCNVLGWTFVNNLRGGDERSTPGLRHVNSSLSNTLTPRVWTNSLDGLLIAFPELAKTPVGFSWFQSETPILLLDTNYAHGRWINPTTLSVDLLWDFSCYGSELEPIVKSDTGGSVQLHSGQPVMHTPDSTFDREVDMTGLQYSYLPDVTVSTPPATFSMQMVLSDDPPQCEPHVCHSTYGHHVRESSPIHNATQNDSVSTARSTQLSPPHPLSPPAHHMTSQDNFQPLIPLNKPPEVETLQDCYLRFIPLLLWIPHDSGLVPCNLPPEYAYLCMGLFFISDLRRAVLQHNVSPTTGVTQGRVCWSVTLQWAPGGEDALFDCDPALSSDVTSDSKPLETTRDLLHPWWFDPTNALLQADSTSPYRPRDLRTQIFSFVPLNLLADFHPSESFPQGWFCKSCGMINIQEFFRHQICQSTMCGSTREKRVPQGKVDSLSSLRDPYQSSTLIRPTDYFPSVVVSDDTTWDDGMQSWTYNVRDGVVLCHIFTGNQKHLQEDADALLERIQCEVLLRKEDHSSSYFTHTTRLSHPSDGSEATVPEGTPDCVRIAYYTLSDVVHRYGEMDKPRFREVRMQAWVNPGSKRGSVFRASKSPAVVHCLGAEVVLKISPKGGYKDAAESTAPDKGKGRAENEDRTRSPHLDHDDGDQALFIPGAEANEMPIVAEHVGEASAVMDTVRPFCILDADGTVAPDPDTQPLGPEMEVAHDGVVEPKQGRVRKKNKVTKDKSKASVPEISMTLVHGDCVVLYGDDFECQIVRTGTTILVIGFPEET